MNHLPVWQQVIIITLLMSLFLLLMVGMYWFTMGIRWLVNKWIFPYIITDEMVAKELEEDRRIGQEQLRKRNGINGKT